MKKKVFAVIVNWNRPQDTIDCVNTLLSSKLKDFELTTIIVDNGSTDDSVKMFNNGFKNKDLIIIQKKANLGFTGGNNVGINYAIRKNADYVLLLNNDTLVDVRMLSCLYQGFKDDTVGITSPKIYFAKGFEFHKARYKNSELGKVIWYAGGKMDWNNVFGKNIGVDEIDHGQFDSEREIDFATGACMMIDAKVFRKIGLFDERFFAYMEDVDFCVRTIKSGFKIRYIPSAFLWHKVSKSSGIGSNLNDYYITRNRLLIGYSYAKFVTKLALFRESLKFLISGRTWQKKGVVDFYLMNFGKGSFKVNA